MMADWAFRNLLDIHAPTLPDYVHAIAHAGEQALLVASLRMFLS